jgi:hypothetical protein
MKISVKIKNAAKVIAVFMLFTAGHYHTAMAQAKFYATAP